MSFWFGDFELDQERRQLLRAGEPVPLEPKAYELLSLLLERRPRALSRAQIRDVIWPQTFVSESTLAVVVNGIRQALEDDARHPRFIRTVHGFGYAFCGEAREVAEGRPQVSETAEERPYPGLLAFTEADAEHFFGRETEVEALWQKVRRQKLLAVIGPSGVGKTSFLRAGVIPSRPSGWGVVYATPGASPALALARALIPDLAGDAEAIGELLQGVQELSLIGDSDRALSAVRSYRKKSDEGLVVVDQFEELLALNAPEVQARFASFLGRLAEEADVHVLLSLRDDFLFRCSEQESLRPIFHDLTPLTPPSAEALRRALVEPAKREGYRFEDEALVEEMVESVEGVKGALPLLAFAVARLWEERDRERKLLTREVYERIEGVAGGLAQHAEATLSQLGPEREGMVREIFRNLVTAQGTRAAADRTELLSVFAEKRDEAGVVLDALVDARLLTEYEAADPEGGEAAAGHRRIEIVHESLLTHWPRLVRWRTQDADGAQLRDQLRQTAHLWDERGRPDDLLWTGTSYLDYRAWRARYAGGLSALEGEFGQAMTAFAERQRRRRRIAGAAVVAALAVGLAAVGVLWTRAEAARRQAAAEALRAEASKLLALGQAELDGNPTAALAYVTKSLELADTEEARRFAVHVLQDGPTAFSASGDTGDRFFVAAFSPNGEWLVEGNLTKTVLRRRGGGETVVLGAEPPSSFGVPDYGFGPDSDLLVGNRADTISLRSLPDGREVRRLKYDEGDQDRWLFVRGRRFFTSTAVGGREIVRWAPLAQGDPRLLGVMAAAGTRKVDAAGSRMAYVPGRPLTRERLYLRSLEDWARPPRLLGTHPAPIMSITFDPGGRHVAAADNSGKIRIWATDGGSDRPERVLDCKGILDLVYSPGGRWLAAVGVAERFYARLWDLTAPVSSEPLQVPIVGIFTGSWGFDPSDGWLATSGTELRPLGAAYPRSVGRQDWFVDDVAFTPDGAALLSVSGGPDGTVRAWPLSPGEPGGGRVLLRIWMMSGPRLAVDPTGGRLAVSGNAGSVFVVPITGGEPRELKGFTPGRSVSAAFSPDGRRLAAAPYGAPAVEKVIRVWDVESGVSRVVGPLPRAGEGAVGGATGLAFLDGDHLVTSSPTTGILSFDLRDGTPRALSSRPAAALAVDRRERAIFAVVGEPDELVRITPDGRAARVFSCPGCGSVALDPTGKAVATASAEGIVRIGPASGGEAHLFFGRASSAGQRVAFSADGRWVASSGEAPSVHLWPVPDVTRTPLHRRSHDEVLATLRSWTNLRAVRDPQSPTGWKLEAGPFPGWGKLPQR